MKHLLLTLLLLASCSDNTKNSSQTNQFKTIEYDKTKDLSIVFSHNINGEMDPCGCRNFPLGGIAQSAGSMHELKDKSHVLYLDSGDTLFSSPIIPETMKTSLDFKANGVAEGLSKVGLKYMTPGDQDFALGLDKLISIVKKNNIQLLVSNFQKELKVNSLEWLHIKHHKNNYVLIGVVDPEVFFDKKNAALFSPIIPSLTKTLTKVKEVFKNKPYKVILVSHSGMPKDKELVKKFGTQFSWIIGSHTQSFLKEPDVENKTKLVQVLSRNHYIGHIKFGTDGKGSYNLIENHESQKDKLKDNPMIAWVDKFKTEYNDFLEKNQITEIDSDESQDIIKHKTFGSCIECHSSQGEFWQKTSHSHAFATLKFAKSENNPECIGCHTLGFATPEGFKNKKDIIITSEAHDKYWADWNKIYSKKVSFKKMDSHKMGDISKKVIKLEEKHKIEHNFKNVQCLNCHTKHVDHPMEDDDQKPKSDYKKACIQCHTTDQSPEWYNKDDKGIATSLNKEYFSKTLKKVSCPKIESE